MEENNNMTFDDFIVQPEEEMEVTGRLIVAEELLTHKFLSPDNAKYFEYLPETSKAYQRGWNDALDMAVTSSPTVIDPRLKKIKKICDDAFNNPDTQDIDKYRAQALANIYAIFLYGDNAP